MSWCDKLASTPTVGFRLSTHFAPSDILLNALSPILDRSSEEEARNTTIDQSTRQFSTGFTISDGFTYSVDEAKVSVQFNHRAKFRPVSGGPPIMEMLSTPRPFTTLLPEVSKRLIEATLLLPEVARRTVRRVGIVSTTPIAADDAPPGINRLIEYLGRPWKGLLESFNVAIHATINETPVFVDRCLHTLVKPEEKGELLTLQFDWQRTFKDEWTVKKPDLERALDDANTNSLRYFEELAEGNRFDEELLRQTASV